MQRLWTAPSLFTRARGASRVQPRTLQEVMGPKEFALARTRGLPSARQEKASTGPSKVRWSIRPRPSSAAWRRIACDAMRVKSRARRPVR